MKRFVFLLLVSSTSFFAQTKMSVESLFEKIDEYYGKNKDYSYSSEYFVYESELSNKIIDHYSGLAIKKGNVNYQKTNKAEFINFTDYSVSINHTEMKILITKNTIKNSIQSLKELLKICNKNKLTEDKLYWICELWSDKKNYKKQFEKIEIYINKNDFSLHRQLFYTTGSQEVFKNNKKKNTQKSSFRDFV